MKQPYVNFISLGWFCAMARALEETGLRTQSSPFDWCISSWYGVEKAISTHFEGYLDEDNLSQEIEERNHYRNDIYGIAFYHDFDQFHPLHEQLPAVKQKYERRIHNFYENINRPTMFFRYICTDDGYDEWNYVMSNYHRIIKLIKSFNSNNDIVFLYKRTDGFDTLNRVKVTNGIHLIPVEAGGRLVQNCEEFSEFLKGFSIPGQQDNIARYKKKQKRKNSISTRLKSKITYQFNIKKYGSYIHSKTYNHIDERKWK